jgi:hypothetical protein
LAISWRACRIIGRQLVLWLCGRAPTALDRLRQVLLVHGRPILLLDKIMGRSMGRCV